MRCGFDLSVRGISFAVPLMWSILFFLNRKPTPLEILSLMSRLRLMIAGKSMPTSPMVKPNSFARWM